MIRRFAHARVFATVKDTDERLSEVAYLKLRAGHHMRAKSHYIFVDPSKRFERIVGFGGAITDASAEVFAALPEEKQREFVKAYFDPILGIGYSLGRTNINSCDFSSDMYTYVADGDAELKTFNIAHDLKYKIPLIKRALSATNGEFSLFASPWSPPAWMKDNNNMLWGGKLLPKYHPVWAKYFVKFIDAYSREGVPVWGITVQNEPEAVQRWESCIYTPEDERDFIRDHLGPQLYRSGMGGVRLIAWDHNRDMLYERARVILSDEETARYVWGIGYHWYVQDCYENVSIVRKAFPHTHLLFTEGCLKVHRDIQELYEWQGGEKYGIAVINDLNRGCEGWCDWNILLDERGGPNHVDNYCAAPVHADTKTGELMYTNAYYYLGHFSKFIRPKYQRIICASTADDLLATAYVSPGVERVVVVILNKSGNDHAIRLAIRNQEVSFSLPPHSIHTIVVE